MTTARMGNAAPLLLPAGFAHPTRNIEALGIEPGMRIADFGSGSGAYVIGIAKKLEGIGHVYAVDVQKDLLRRTLTEAADKGFSNVEIVWGDLEKDHGSKIADESLDLVLISNLLFQVEDKKRVVTEAKRIVRPLARVAIIDWTESFGNMGPHTDRVVTKKEAYDLALEAGLLFVSEFEAGAHHYGLIFRKNTIVRV